MAGYMYFNKKRVCPAILVGGEEQKNCLFRIPDDVTEITIKDAFSMKFSRFTYPIDIDFNNLEYIRSSASGAFYNCFAGTRGSYIRIRNLKTVSASGLAAAFSDTTHTFDLDLSKLQSIEFNGMDECFDFNDYLPETISFDSLNYVAESGLIGCFALTNVKEIFFRALTSQSFGNATNQFMFMLSGNQDCIVHFPSNLQSVIGSWDDVVNGFGGTNTTVLFDLPATE